MIILEPGTVIEKFNNTWAGVPFKCPACLGVAQIEAADRVQYEGTRAFVLCPTQECNERIYLAKSGAVNYRGDDLTPKEEG